MNINFTGVKNISYKYQQYREDYDAEGNFVGYLNPQAEIDNDEYDEDVYEHNLTFQLTDDSDGNDLTEFRNNIKSSDVILPPEQMNSDMFTVSIIKEDLTEPYTSPITSIYLNDLDEEVNVNDNNLSFLSYIGKLFKKIIRQEDSNFANSKNVLKNGVNEMSELFTDRMIDYFS